MHGTMRNSSNGFGFPEEMYVGYLFSKQGKNVSFPLVSCAYDLIVDDKGSLYRVQVKKAWWAEQRRRPKGLGGRAGWVVELGRNRKREGGRKRYMANEFDFLSVVCGDDVYNIPSSKISNSETGFVLRVLEIKPEVPDGGRKDSIEAAQRWLPWKNNFSLSKPNVEARLAMIPSQTP